MTITRQDIERLRELLEKATPGPWQTDRDRPGICSIRAPDGHARPYDDGSVPDVASVWRYRGNGPGTIDGEFLDNAALIAEARSLLPALLDLVVRQDEALKLIESIARDGRVLTALKAHLIAFAAIDDAARAARLGETEGGEP